MPTSGYAFSCAHVPSLYVCVPIRRHVPMYVCSVPVCVRDHAKTSVLFYNVYVRMYELRALAHVCAGLWVRVCI